MEIFYKEVLVEFYSSHPDCKKTLEKWYHDVLAKGWKKPSDITNDFNTARGIKGNRAVFKINGNAYRLIVEVNYLKGWVIIQFLGTHASYDKIDPETVKHFKLKKK